MGFIKFSFSHRSLSRCLVMEKCQSVLTSTEIHARATLQAVLIRILTTGVGAGRGSSEAFTNFKKLGNFSQTIRDPTVKFYSKKWKGQFIRIRNILTNSGIPCLIFSLNCCAI